MNATLRLHTEFHVGEVDRRVFGGFLEHLGRAVYEGVYDPGNPLSDANGFRKDVIEAIKGLRMPIVRYPGGNFVSNYRWTDGIGPRDQRPKRLDYAWRSLEPNTFGTDEFMAWCRQAETAPMLAVNLGTLGASEAEALVEYCNMPAGSYWADRRVANGRREPYGVKVWCLGNEMDGPWQAGHVPAEEYARRADQAGKLMKGLDRSIQLVLCGSSHRGMPTYLEWDRVALEYCWDHVDFVSAHRYSENRRNDTGWFLAEGVEIDRIIQDYRGLFDYVRGRKRARKQVYLSFDEWNVWYKSTGGDGDWKVAQPLLEEAYNLEDALVCAQYLLSFVRNADVVKMACLAQIVNVIAPIMTRKDGILIQPNYYPLQLMAAHAVGRSLRPLLTCPTYRAGDRGDVPALDVAATLDGSGGLAVFAVNRSGAEDAELTLIVDDAVITEVRGADVLSGADPKAVNDWEHPRRVVPQAGNARLAEGKAVLKVPKYGFVALRAATRPR